MDSKEDPHFVLDLINLAFQITGKAFPCHLQRKLDKYTKLDDSNVTMNIRRTVMIFINDRLTSDEVRVDVASEIYEAKKKELLKKYKPSDFLKFLSYFAYASVSEFINNKLDSPDIFLASMARFMESMRKKGRVGADFWKTLDQSACRIVEDDRNKNNYQKLRKSSADLEMPEEKGFVLKMINWVFDYYLRHLPPYLRVELDKYRLLSEDDPNIKNALFIILNELDKKESLLGGIDPIVLYYYNLSCYHFQEKYFLEFCVCLTKKALIEYSNESLELSPMKSYELLVYILLLAKEDGKFSSLEGMNDAASKIAEEDRDRIEHERMRRDVSVNNSSESAAQAMDSENSGQHSGKVDCKCCTLT